MRRAGEVVLGRLVAVDHSPVHDGVQSPVERAVTESVEPAAASYFSRPIVKR
jgi:hypothetical protein